MKYYINIFLVYSILGFIVEHIIKYLFAPKMNSGVLFGPWVPIYGFGCCLVIIIMRFVFNRIKTNRIIKIILVFLISMITLTTLEFIGGNLIELVTGKVFWDYSNQKYNFGHYISLEMALLWGVMSLVIVYILKPLFDKIIKKIPSGLTYLVLSLFIIDLVITFLKA